MPDFALVACLTPWETPRAVGWTLPRLELDWKTAVSGACVAAVASYSAYRVGGAAHRGVRRLRAWWRGPDKLVPAPLSTRVGECVPESAIPGSEERLMTAPRSQGLAGYSVDGKFYVAGCVVRLDRWLLIPDHVKSVIVGSIELRTMDQSRSITLTKSEYDQFVVVDTDMLALELGEARFSELGLAKAAVASHLPERLGAYVSIVGAYGKGTTGTVSHARHFGKIDYTASTFKGYSGSAYMSGSQLVGVHLHGGRLNSGYSASYLLCNLKHLFKIRDEDTAEWLEAVRARGGKLVLDSSWRGSDDIRVRIAGRYHIVERDSVARAYGRDWERSIELGEVAYHDFRDNECAGEVSGGLPGASSSSISLPHSLDELVLRLTPDEFAKLQQLVTKLAKRTSRSPSPAQPATASRRSRRKQSSTR